LYVYDVVGEWRSLTGLPAVLAMWTARRDVATPEVAADFLASRDFGLSRVTEICFDAARELELPQRTLESYLRHNIDFSLAEEKRSPCRHLPDRPQHQLHEFLHRVLFFLRVLPPARREGRLHSAVRGNLQENRRNARARRHRNFAPGRPAPGLADRLLRKSFALLKSALPASAPALFFRARDSLHRGSQ